MHFYRHRFLPFYRQRILPVWQPVDRIMVRAAKTRIALIVLLAINVLVLWSMFFVEYGSNADIVVTTRCSEFATWQEAEDYWIENQDIPQVLNGLDSNGNGIPCETLEDYPGANLPRADMRFVCDDFDHWEQAQRYFETYVDEYPELLSLDGDRNGVACQDIPAFEDIVAVVKRLNRLEREGLR